MTEANTKGSLCVEREVTLNHQGTLCLITAFLCDMRVCMCVCVFACVCFAWLCGMSMWVCVCVFMSECVCEHDPVSYSKCQDFQEFNTLGEKEAGFWLVWIGPKFFKQPSVYDLLSLKQTLPLWKLLSQTVRPDTTLSRTNGMHSMSFKYSQSLGQIKPNFLPLRSWSCNGCISLLFFLFRFVLFVCFFGVWKFVFVIISDICLASRK